MADVTAGQAPPPLANIAADRLQEAESGPRIPIVYGSCTRQGLDHENEDRICISDHDDFMFFLVSDGHDGPEAASFAEQHLNWNTKRALDGSAQQDANDDVVTLDHALREGVLSTDSQFCQKARRNGWTAGACVAACAVRGHHFAAASAGDCAVVYHDEHGEFGLLCHRHVATDAAEAARIRACGGFIRDGRILGILAPSRGIGDTDVRDNCPGATIPDPHVQSRILPRKFVENGPPVFAVIGSDGVFDSLPLDVIVLSTKRVLLLNRQNPNRAEIAAKRIVKQCIPHTRDDISVVVVCFGP
ncbi:PPM-type phosphatase domain-containing protein [Plasmodiophora brassicae]